MSEILDLLLKSHLPDVQKDLPTAKYKVKRLSREMGAPVVFTLRALPYGRVQELKEMGGADRDVHLVLKGVAEPDLRDTRLREKYSAATPAEVVRAMFLPGEIENMALAVEKLCGYRSAAIEEIKNA